MQLVKPVGGQRFASLDGLRGIACVVVVICHYLQIYVPAAFERNFPDLFGEKWLVNSPLNLLFNGHAAVILFFVLSGFVLSAPFFRGVGWGWYARSIIKRYPRLAIPALASSLLACGLIAIFGVRYAELNAYSGSNVTTFLPTAVDFRLAAWEGAIGSFFDGKFSYNPVLWTIQAELFGSLLVLVLVPLVGRLPAWVRYAVYATVIWRFASDNMVAFAFGVLASDLLLRQPRVQVVLARKWASALAFVLGLYLLSKPYYIPYVNFWWPVDWLMPDPTMLKPHVTGAFLLILSIASIAPMRSLLEGRTAQFLGRQSYSLYLVHFPLLGTLGALVILPLVARVGYGWALLLAFPLVMALCLALSVVFNRWIDEKAVAFSSWLAGALWRERR